MYSLTIVGGGQISCGYDSPDDENILTHINGAFHHDKITLDAVIELNKDRQEYITNKWGNSFSIYDDIEKSIEKHKSNIFIVATPTNTHFKIIKKILSLCVPVLIICEKPIVSSNEELEKLNKLMDDCNTKIITNFPRRFDKALNILREKIAPINEKYYFNGVFTKGLIHNGSHMIDLVSMLIGNISSINSINKEIIDDDYYGQFFVKTDSCNGIITNINTMTLSIFELTIYTNIAKIEIIGATKEITINYTDKSNLAQGFETYVLKTEIPYTSNKSAYYTFEYAIKLLEDDVKYTEFKIEQYDINKLIFETKKRLMELK